MRPSRHYLLLFTSALVLGTAGHLGLPEYLLLNRVTNIVLQEANWNGLWNRRLTGAIEQRFNLRLAFRWFWVGLDRQLSFSLFRELPRPSTGTRVVVGRNGWLYEDQYLQAYVQPGRWNEADCENYAEQVSRVQNRLAERGIAFAFVVAPSKPEVYPEHLPAEYMELHDRRAGPPTYECLRPHLRAKGVHLLDAPELMLKWKSEGMKELFSPIGSHWTYYAACRIIDELRNTLGLAMKRPIPQITWNPGPPEAPILDDRDLLRRANLLLPSSALQPVSLPHPQLTSEVPRAAKPRILWINDSFGWQLLHLLYAADAVAPTKSFFYFRSAYLFPGREKSAENPQNIDLSAFLADFDAVVIVQTKIATEERCWGAVKALDDALR